MAPLQSITRVPGMLRVIRDVLVNQARTRGGYGHALAYYSGMLRREGLHGLIWRVNRREHGIVEPSIPDHAYRAWIDRYDTINDADRETIAVDIGRFARRPLISILVSTHNSEARLFLRMIDSISDQLYPHWELCIADDASTDNLVRRILAQAAERDSRIKTVFRESRGDVSDTGNSALALARGEYVALLAPDAVLPPHALYMVARYINLHPGAQMFYSDEDKLAPGGERTAPHFKCDWNPLLFLAHDIFSHLGIFETALVREVGGFRKGFEGSQNYDLALRCVERCGNNRVVHIPHVLYHGHLAAGSTAGCADDRHSASMVAKRVVADHLRRCGINASVEVLPDGLSLMRVRYALPPRQPLVSIIIPARDGVHLTRQCVESILKKTVYRNYEIIIVDNGSVEAETLAYFDEIALRPNVKILRDDAPFNFSALNNRAAHEANGDYLCLLNNDVEVISPDWLNEMVSLAAQPGNGAVGARLWYPNDTVQHAGVLVGLGGVGGHVNLGARRGQAGYFGRAVVSQNMTAVTAACLVVRKEAYERVGGLNTDLKVAYNDVDFCLRLVEAGYRNVWTPHAELYHHESASRGSDMEPEKRARFVAEARWMQAKWGTVLDRDPAYNRNLTLNPGQPFFSLASPPRIGKLE